MATTVRNLLGIASLAVETLHKVEIQTVSRKSKTASQQTFVVVTALGDLPGSGGSVYEVMVKSDGTEGILYEQGEHPKMFKYNNGIVIFKQQF